MIKASECRVGNKLYFQFAPDQARQTVTVSWVSDDSLGYYEQHEASYPQSPKSFTGVPLTPETLGNLGFGKYVRAKDYIEADENHDLDWADLADWVVYEIKGFYIGLRNGGYFPVRSGAFYDESTGLHIVGRQVEFVHDLQNLFYALCGEELTIKEPA